MTTNSQILSVKVVQTAFKRGLYSLMSILRLQGTSVPTLTEGTSKRLFDIVFSLAVLIFCSPLYLILAILIKISSPGPIFYAQKRVGKDFQTFHCVKFRTMVNNADQVLETMLEQCPKMKKEFEENFKLKKDPRITWIGQFLRYTSLDEFPQFWNVLMGDMSVVGPRPLVPNEIPKYGYRMRKVLTVRPGITGLWQVSGRNDIPYDKRIKIDVYYANTHNWAMDIWIILKTVGVMLFPRNNGAY
jgi:lipopolysaccharide/colanic/teichoic acid biosynthesis glycosyltransferase